MPYIINSSPVSRAQKRAAAAIRIWLFVCGKPLYAMIEWRGRFAAPNKTKILTANAFACSIGWQPGCVVIEDRRARRFRRCRWCQAVAGDTGAASATFNDLLRHGRHRDL